MTINNEHTQKSAIPMGASYNNDDLESDAGQRRVPGVRPSTAASSRPMPAQQFIRSKALAKQEPLDPSKQTEASSPAVFNQQPEPLLHAPPAARKGRHPPVAVAAALVILAILIALGVFFAQNLASSTADQAPGIQQAGPTDRFVQPLLTSRQIDSLQHLVGYMHYKQLASMYVARMPLDVELGQLIMVEYNDDHYSPELDTMINTLHAGGVIMYAFQMKTFAQTKNDIAHMQKRATFPLLIATDEEGGPYVERLGSIYGPRMSATDMFNTGDPAVAAQQGLKTSRDLAALGINEDLAPDVDVNQVNGYDMLTRTFGNTAQQVIRFAGPYLQALQGNGTIACIKHYPGLGGASPDAHVTLPVVNSSRQQIYATDLAPFKAFIQSPERLLNPAMIMPTNVLMPAIDPTFPAELSHIFMTDILRKQFGYDGVVLTDALYMQGIAAQWTMPQAAVLALNAGNDMLLGPNGPDQTIATLDAIKQALRDGTLAKARVDEAVTRIIALKLAYHLMPAVPPQG